MKKHFLSVYKDHKTGIASIFFIVLGVILLLAVIILNVTSIDVISDSQKGSMLAFAIIFLFVGFIFYFFKCQFAKLAEIATEIENMDEEQTEEK